LIYIYIYIYNFLLLLFFFLIIVTEEITIKQVADAIVKYVGFEGEYKFDPSKADGQYKKTATNAKLMRLNPTFKFTDFDTGKNNFFFFFFFLIII